MFREATREVDDTTFSELREACERGVHLGSAMVGRRLIGGTEILGFEVSNGEESLLVSLQPVDGSIVVNYDEAEEVPSYAVIVDDEQDSAWKLSSDTVSSMPFLPTLTTAFNEAERVHDREADYRYEFEDGTSFVAAYADDPVERLDEPVTFTRMRFLGGMFPRKWLFESTEGEVWYLRERSGAIRLYRGTSRQPDACVFDAFIGRDHPGTHLTDDEVVRLVTSVDYINIVEDPDDISQDALDAYHDAGPSMEELIGGSDDIPEPADLELPDDEEFYRR